MENSRFHMQWIAHEYEHKERGSDWFWAVGIVAVALAIAAVIFDNMLLGILILIGAFSLSLFVNRPPRETEVVVDERGITRDRTHYPYSTLKSFHIDIEHPHKKILLRSEKIFMPLVIIPLSDEVDAEELHAGLSQVLQEEFHTLPFIEKLLEYFGF